MPEAAPKVRTIRVYSRPAALANLDQRSREARLMRETRAELVRHVGGSPSATQKAIIERAVQLTLRVAMMDKKFAETGVQTDHDSRTYLAWSGSLARLLRDLGMQSAAEQPRSLADHLASRAAAS